MYCRMKRHPNFKGGTIKASHGYILRYVGKKHHLADIRGYAYEHRLVAEKKIGGKLKKWEIVHHLDSNRANNEPENIEVLKNNSVHLNQHRKSKSNRRFSGQRNTIVKCECGCGGKFRKFDELNRLRRFIAGHHHRGNKRWWSIKRGAKNQKRV